MEVMELAWPCIQEQGVPQERSIDRPASQQGIFSRDPHRHRGNRYGGTLSLWSTKSLSCMPINDINFLQRISGQLQDTLLSRIHGNYIKSLKMFEPVQSQWGWDVIELSSCFWFLQKLTELPIRKFSCIISLIWVEAAWDHSCSSSLKFVNVFFFFPGRAPVHNQICGKSVGRALSLIESIIMVDKVSSA